MATYFRDGFRGTCTSPASGTGPYTAIVAVSGYRSFASLTDGDQVLVGVRSATTWGEAGVYTKSGGATPTLTRTRIDITINSNSSPVDWPPGTPLVIFSTLDGADTPALLANNTWQGDQSYNAHKLRMSPDGQSYVAATSNNILEFYVANASHTTMLKGSGGENGVGVTWADNGATPGPFIILDRNSTSPSAADGFGFVDFQGRNSLGVVRTYAGVHGRIKNATSGAEKGGLAFFAQDTGNAINVGEWNDDYLVAFSTFQNISHGILVGKGAQSLSGIGVEILSNGHITSTVTSTHNMDLNRKGSDGPFMSFYNDDVPVGTLLVSGGKLGFSGAVIIHNSAWPAGVQELDLPLYSVLCSLPEIYPGDPASRHPLSVVSSSASDPTVYGVYGGTVRLDAKQDAPHDGIMVQAGGAGLIRAQGPVLAGDFLESSEQRGVARAQADGIFRNTTVAKARKHVPDDGQVYVIPCTLLGG